MIKTRAKPSFKHDLSVYWRSFRLQVRASMALRGAFIAQIAGMMLNNTGFVFAWWFLFSAAGSINGWSVNELIGLQGINMLIFGVVMLLSTGILDLPRHVDRGSFDTFLTRPAPVLSQLAGSNVDVTTIGDILLGMLLTGWYIAVTPMDLANLALFVVAMVVGCVLFWCFAILLPPLIAFYVFDAERLMRYLGTVFLDTGLYPTGVLTGTMRTFLLVGIPGLAIGTIQLEALRSFGWQEVAIAAGVAAFWLPLSLWLFKRAVRRYESSNLVGAR